MRTWPTDATRFAILRERLGPGRASPIDAGATVAGASLSVSEG